MVSYRGRRSKILTATGLSGRWRSYTTTPRQIVIVWLLARLPSMLPDPGYWIGAAPRGQRGRCGNSA